MANQSFAEELRERVKPEQARFFLKVIGRGLEFPLHRCEKLSQRVLLVPGMILVVIQEKEYGFVVKWHGPTFQCDSHASKEKPRYSESAAFTLDVPKIDLISGKVRRLAPSQVRKMKHHVPAVLY